MAEDWPRIASKMAATLNSPLSLDAKLRDALPLVWFVSLWSNDLYFMLQYTVTKGQTLELKLALYLSVATEDGPYSTTTNPPLKGALHPAVATEGGPIVCNNKKCPRPSRTTVEQHQGPETWPVTRLSRANTKQLRSMEIGRGGLRCGSTAPVLMVSCSRACSTTLIHVHTSLTNRQTNTTLSILQDLTDRQQPNPNCLISCFLPLFSINPSNGVTEGLYASPTSGSTRQHRHANASDRQASRQLLHNRSSKDFAKNDLRRKDGVGRRVRHESRGRESRKLEGHHIGVCFTRFPSFIPLRPRIRPQQLVKRRGSTTVEIKTTSRADNERTECARALKFLLQVVRHFTYYV